MRKYENVDIIAALGAVVEVNTEHYKSDFRFDIETLKKAARHPEGEAARFLWMSRKSGTWCLSERGVYVKDTSQFNTWNSYATILGASGAYPTVVVEDRIIAYAVHVKGMTNGRVTGDLYELDYRDHLRHISRAALQPHTVSVTYEDGAALRVPFRDYHAQRTELFNKHGFITHFQVDPEDAGALRDILKTVRAERENEAQPAVFKVRVKNVKPQERTATTPRKPTIKQDIAAGRAQIDAQQAAAPRAAAHTNHITKGANSHDDF